MSMAMKNTHFSEEKSSFKSTMQHITQISDSLSDEMEEAHNVKWLMGKYFADCKIPNKLCSDIEDELAAVFQQFST